MEPSLAVRVIWVAVMPLLATGCIERALRPREQCGDPDISRTVQIKNIDKVDLLFVIDNSGSMQDEQAKLREQIPRLTRTLLTGSRGPDDPKPFAPVRDLHVAVVSSDMGADEVQGCSEHGADGVFQHAPSGAACEASYPPFLSYLARTDASPEAFASDVACIADVGSEGCSREQPLEAALKALWPASDSRFEFAGGPSHGADGAANKGFLRSDPRKGLSLYAVVVVSDEDDASPFPLSRYVQGFHALREGNERLGLFSAITSVPPDLVDAAARSGIDFSGGRARDAYYDKILSDPRMQSVEDDGSEHPEGSPGRRYVELVKALGEDARLTAIGQDDYSQALDVVTDIVGLKLDAVCLEDAQVRDERGVVACDVIWELPPERINFDTPITCGDRPEFLTRLPGRAESGGQRCLVKQRVAHGEVPESGEGWYYDDFSEALADTCAPRTKQRVAFTANAAPPTGVTLTINCWNAGSCE